MTHRLEHGSTEATKKHGKECAVEPDRYLTARTVLSPSTRPSAPSALSVPPCFHTHWITEARSIRNTRKNIPQFQQPSTLLPAHPFHRAPALPCLSSFRASVFQPATKKRGDREGLRASRLSATSHTPSATPRRPSPAARPRRVPSASPAAESGTRTSHPPGRSGGTARG